MKIKNIALKKIFHHFLVKGLLLSLFSYFIAYTMVVPFFVVIFVCAPLEIIASLFVTSKPYTNIIYLVEFILIISIILSLLFISIVKNIKKWKKESINYNIFLVVQFILIQALGFYICWGNKTNYKSDGQTILGIFDSFQTTSVVFIPFMILQELLNQIPFQKITLFYYSIFNKDKLLSKTQKASIFEKKVNELIYIHKEKSNKELQDICIDEGWTAETKEAAKRILQNRNVF
jgi:hypothetical protein